MTIFARLLSLPAASRRTAAARGAFLVAGILTIGLLLVAPAGAVVSTVGSTTVGLQPRNVVSHTEGVSGPTFANPAGNPVVHGSNLYAIYWDPTDAYHPEWQRLVDAFMQQLGSESGTLGNVFAVASQYTDKTNTPASYNATFRVSYTDTHKYPGSGCVDPHPLQAPNAIACLTDAQIQEELQGFIAQHGLPKGMSSIFYLLTPPGVTICLDGAATRCSDYTRSTKEEEESKFESESYTQSFCSYHSDINPDNVSAGNGNTVLYAAIPWIAGGAGNYHLQPVDQTQGYECQDGGFDPSTKPPEKKETPKEKTEAETKEFEKLPIESKLKALELEERERPHEQEPNQVGLGEDGAYDTGLADLIINQIAVEQQNTVTDPLLNAWQDAGHREATDECRNFFASGTLGGASLANESTLAGTLSNQIIGGTPYYLNNAFNVAAYKLTGYGVPCVAGVNLNPKFTAPNPVRAGDTVGFDGMESDVMLNAGTAYSNQGVAQSTYAKFSWDFGDGTPVVSGYAPGAPACEAPWLSPCAASAFHSYQYGGTYEVTLTVTDVGGNVASVTHPVTVSGSPRPSSEPSSGGSTGSGQAVPSGSPSTTNSATSIPAPRVTAAFVSRSLKSALGKAGLVVRYSVNEQVAGHFEVLLSSVTAHKLGITGPAASGLAPGTPAQTVIAKAILVTQKGGSSVVHIQLSKRTAARMHRLGKVSLMLRLSVRNAASHLPTVTTVLSTATLSH